MNSDELPYCEGTDGKFGPSFYNCPDDEDAMVNVAERRIEQITKQLDCPHGLTTRERRALANERKRWRRWISQKRPPAIAVDEARQTRNRKRENARKKKLEWFARKIERGSG